MIIFGELSCLSQYWEMQRSVHKLIWGAIQSCNLRITRTLNTDTMNVKGLQIVKFCRNNSSENDKNLCSSYEMLA